MKTIVTIRMDVNGEEVIVDGYIHYTFDTRYGADADGNRAWKEVFIKDVTDIDACDSDGHDVVLSEKNLERASNKLMEKFFMEGY